MPSRAAVTDTHALLYHAGARPARLGPRARIHFAACEKRAAILYVPTVVVWETTLLARYGRVDLGRSVRAFFDGLFSNAAYQPLDLTPEQVHLAAENPPNDDPFDARICAAARDLGLPLITRDQAITESGLVKVLW